MTSLMFTSFKSSRVLMATKTMRQQLKPTSSSPSSSSISSISMYSLFFQQSTAYSTISKPISSSSSVLGSSALRDLRLKQHLPSVSSTSTSSLPSSITAISSVFTTTMRWMSSTSTTTDINQTPRPILRVADILKNIESKYYSVPGYYSITEAISHVVRENLSSALVVNEEGGVIGIITARDLLRLVGEHNTHSLTDFILQTKLTDVMTPKDKLIYCSPNDSLRKCREIMFQCKIRNLPIIDTNNEVRGIVTMKMLSDSAFSLMDIGGKKGFIHNVTGRRGLPDDARIHFEDQACDICRTNSTGGCLDIEVGSFALPHPFKNENGVAMDHRSFGPQEFSEEIEYSEDAHFAIRVKAFHENPDFVPESFDPTEMILPLSIVNEPSKVYLCVADGVGSWREYDVDPREFSHK